MKKLIWIVLLLIAAGAGGAFLYTNRAEKEPVVTTLKTSRGSIIDAVGATGTLQAVRTVTVGTQVSGIVQELYTDFNGIVKKGDAGRDGEGQPDQRPGQPRTAEGRGRRRAGQARALEGTGVAAAD